MRKSLSEDYICLARRKNQTGVLGINIRVGEISTSRVTVFDNYLECEPQLTVQDRLA
jgi:hypothetical protein